MSRGWCLSAQPCLKQASHNFLLRQLCSKSQSSSNFKASACITFAAIPWAKTSLMVKPRIQVGKNYTRVWVHHIINPLHTLLFQNGQNNSSLSIRLNQRRKSTCPTKPRIYQILNLALSLSLRCK